MTEFKPEKIDLADINGGNEYKNGDGFGAEAINAPIKASAYAQSLADNKPRYAGDDAQGATPDISIEDSGDGTPRLVFKNLNSNGSNVFVGGSFAERVEFTSDPQTQIDGKAESFAVENEIAVALQESKDYTDTKAGDTLADSKDYTDGRISKTTEILNALNTKIDENLVASEEYTEERISETEDFIATIQSDLGASISNLATEVGNIPNIYATTEYVKQEFAKKTDISSVYKYRGTLEKYEYLPTSGQVVGDTYNILTAYGIYPAGTNFAWAENQLGEGFWDALGGDVDLSIYAQKSEIPTKTSELQNDSGFVTQEDLPSDIPQLSDKIEEGGTNAVTSGALYDEFKNVREVQRIDVGALNDNGDTSKSLAVKISEAIAEAYENRPSGAERANIEFYNFQDISPTTGLWSFVTFQSNCNYRFAEETSGNVVDFIFLTNIKNCDFENIVMPEDYPCGIVTIGCENLQLINCHFGDTDSQIQNGSTDIYFENCYFRKKIIVDDAGDQFHWVMLENCVFKKTEGVTAIVASRVTNTKNLLTISNCHFDDLTKVSKSDVSAGAGKVTIVATEDEIPSKVSQLENDSGFATTIYVDEKASKVYRFRGSVNYFEELPTTDNAIGDTYNVVNAYGVYQGGTNFAWDGTAWDALGGALDLSVFVKKTDYATPTANGIMLATDKAKLDSIDTGANKYTLPTATGARLGGVIVGDNLSVDGNGILKGNYQVATTTKEGLMGTNDKFLVQELYSKGGKSYYAFGEVGWDGGTAGSNPIYATITYTNTCYKRGLLSVSYILTTENGTEDENNDKWHLSIAKINALLKSQGVQIKAPATAYYGGLWTSQIEALQETPRTKARTCTVTPYVILPYAYWNNGAEILGGTIGTKNFQTNEFVYMWNIPIEEA